jgi:hypothetical protein
MIVFVIEINGRSILAFNADSQLEAEQHAMSPQIRSDLMAKRCRTNESACFSMPVQSSRTRRAKSTSPIIFTSSKS